MILPLGRGRGDTPFTVRRAEERFWFL
jgi:hypothetical protein